MPPAGSTSGGTSEARGKEAVRAAHKWMRCHYHVTLHRSKYERDFFLDISFVNVGFYYTQGPGKLKVVHMEWCT